MQMPVTTDEGEFFSYRHPYEHTVEGIFVLGNASQQVKCGGSLGLEWSYVPTAFHDHLRNDLQRCSLDFKFTQG
jgi:hypothetical protein